MDPNLHELIAGGDEGEVEAIIRLSPSGAVPPDVRIVARFGDIATCRLPRNRIVETWADHAVLSLKAAQPFRAGFDPVEEEDGEEPVEGIGNPPRRPEGLATTGRGVIVAVIDWGFDFAHDNFRRDDGSTRILALWDQSSDLLPHPEPYGYGRVFQRAEINRALRSATPYKALGYHHGKSDPRGKGCHGTHVLDIAAGNGRLEGSVAGVAPAADLLLVHASSPGIREPSNLGDSVTLLEALDWIRAQAGARPFVVNMSVGRHGGPHTGLTLVEQCMDRLLGEAPGRCIVQSAGNYYAANVHASGQLRPGQTRILRWQVDPADRTANELEIWYAKSDALSVTLTPPTSENPLAVPLGGHAPIKEGGQVVGRFYHRARDPSNGDNHINIFLYAGAPAGEWRVKIYGEDIVDGRYHCWVERDSSCARCQSRLHPDDADSRTTTGTICNGHRSIAAGAYDAHHPARPLGRFSSAGPTVDGRVKPDVLAPGVRVLAAKSTRPDSQIPEPGLALNSGTSMASPHVAGCIANMFEAASRPLAIAETRRLLLSTAEPADFANTEDECRAGSGYLDILGAVQAAAGWTRNKALSEEALPEVECSDAEAIDPAAGLNLQTPGATLEAAQLGDDDLREIAERCGALLAASDLPPRRRARLMNLIEKALAPGSADLYIDGTSEQVRRLAKESSPRLPDSEFLASVAKERVRADLRSLPNADHLASCPVNELLSSLDERILAGIHLIAEHTARSADSGTANPLLRQMSHFVAEAQRNPHSIYFGYGLGQI